MNLLLRLTNQTISRVSNITNREAMHKPETRTPTKCINATNGPRAYSFTCSGQCHLSCQAVWVNSSSQLLQQISFYILREIRRAFTHLQTVLPEFSAGFHPYVLQLKSVGSMYNLVQNLIKSTSHLVHQIFSVICLWM